MSISLNLLVILPIMMMIFSYLFYIFNKKHFLNNLLALEMMAVSIYFLIFMYFLSNMKLVLILYYMVMVVCESVLGLSMLMILIYSYGEDYSNNMSMSIC